MRKKYLLGMVLVMVTILGLKTPPAHSQSATDGLSLKLAPGVMSYYGDMSTTNFNPFTIFSTTTRFGGSAGLIKQFNPWFAIQAQFGGGWLYAYRDVAGDNPNPTEMEGELTEFGLSLRVDPLKAFFTDGQMKISPYVSAGVATIGYRSVRRDVATSNVILGTQNTGYENDGVTPKNPKPSGMAIPITIGVGYQALPNFSIEAEYGVRLTNTDLLDALKGNTNVNDFYSLLTVGLRYHFNPATKTSASRVKTSSATRSPASSRTRSNLPLKRTSTRSESGGANQNIPLTNVFIESQIPQNMSTNKIYEVILRINKGDYTGKARLTQQYPQGFTAMEAINSNASFSFSNQTVIIEWDQMPSTPELVYSYQLRVGESVVGSQTVNGRFEYQQPDGEKTNRFNNYIFVDNNLEAQMDRRFQQLLGEDQSNISKTTEGIDPVSREEQNYQARIDELLNEYGGTGSRSTAGGRSGAGSEVIISSGTPLAGVEYRIQVGAFKDKSQGGARLANRYGITEPLKEEYGNAYYKYTVGSFRNYQDAVKFRDSFIQRTKLWSSFVVAYRDGKRLSKLSDALR